MLARSGVVLAVLLAAAVAGCQRPVTPASYTLMTGTVSSRLVDTGELTIDAAPEFRSNRAPEPIACVVTTDSEIYIRDRFAGLRDVEPGDRVEVLGQWQRDRLVVATLRVDRPLPNPPIPAILTESDWPASRPAMSDSPASTRPRDDARPEQKGS